MGSPAFSRSSLETQQHLAPSSPSPVRCPQPSLPSSDRMPPPPLTSHHNPHRPVATLASSSTFFSPITQGGAQREKEREKCLSLVQVTFPSSSTVLPPLIHRRPPPPSFFHTGRHFFTATGMISPLHCFSVVALSFSPWRRKAGTAHAHPFSTGEQQSSMATQVTYMDSVVTLVRYTWSSPCPVSLISFLSPPGSILLPFASLVTYLCVQIHGWG
jgi:hypothetical protein